MINLIKKCKVVLANADVVVFEFEGKTVQTNNFSDIKSDFIFVKHDNKNYSITTEQEYEKSLIKKSKKEISEDFKIED